MNSINEIHKEPSADNELLGFLLPFMCTVALYNGNVNLM